MINVSSRFVTTVQVSHQVLYSAVVSNPAGTPLASLQLVGGTVTASSKQLIRRSASVTLTDPSGVLTARNVGDLLTPNGNEIALQRGVTYPDGSTELVPLGVFGITKYGLTVSGGSLLITLEGQDRARRVSRSPFSDVYAIPAGTNTGTAIKNLVSLNLPTATFSFMPVTATLPLTTYDAGADPWTAAVTLAAGLGAEVFFDANGVCALQPVPDPATGAVAFAFADGPAGVASAWTKTFDDSNAANSIVVTGEAPGTLATVSAIAQDNDPASPTYVGGPYGVVTRLIVDRTITTTGQAQTRANAELLIAQGLSLQVQGDVLVLPMLEPGDIATITSPRAGIHGQFVLDGLTIPFGLGLMTVTARRRSD